MNGRNEAMKRLADAAARANTPLLRVFLGGVLVALAAFAVYANTLKNGFVWDDHVLIVNNPFVQDWANVRKLFSADYYAGVATSDVENAARPMWILSALVDVKLWGLFPAGHHLTSAVLHSLNSLLVFALGASLGGLAVALMAGLLFAVHPVHTEAVAAVGFRADLLAAFFALAAFLLYRARERWSGSGAAVAAARWGLLAASLLAYGAGLLSKEMAATLPLLLILHDRLLDPRTDAGLWRRAPLYLPYAALTGAYFMFHAHRSDFGFGGWLEEAASRAVSLLSFAASAHAGWAASPTPSVSSLLAADPLTNVMTMTTVIARYVGLLFWPQPLSADYAVLPQAAPTLPVLASAALVFGAAVAATAFSRRSPVLAWAALCFLASLLPVSNIKPIFNVMAERYLYLPSIFFCVGAAWASARLFVRPAWRPFIAGAWILVLSAFAALTIERNRVWNSDKSLWERTVRDSPGAARAWYNLALEAAKEGDYDSAERHYRRALVLRPDHVEARTNLSALRTSGAAVAELKKLTGAGARSPVPYMNLGNLLFSEGKIQEALATYEEIERKFRRHEYSDVDLFLNMARGYALTGEPAKAEEYFRQVWGADQKLARARFDLAKSMAARKQFPDAERHYLAALALRPDWAQARVNLGVIFHHMGRLDEAVEMLRQGLALNPRQAVGHYNLGTVYNDRSELELAEKHFEEAIRLDPVYDDAYYNLAVVQQRTGRFREAIRSYEKAAEIKPRRVETLSNLAGCYIAVGDLARGEEYCRRAIAADPTRSAPYGNLGTVFRRQGRLDEAIAQFQMAIRVDPMDAGAYNNLGSLYMSRGDLDKAEQELLSAVRADPRFADAHYNLGLVWAKSGRVAEAVQAFRVALTLNPRHSGAVKALQKAGAAGFK